VFTFFRGAGPAVYWYAVSVALASLALWLSPYLFGEAGILLGPILLAIAVGANAVASRSPSTMPIAAFIAVLLALPLISYGVLLAYAMGLRIPLLFQNAAFVWPQLIFFGSALWTSSPAEGPVLPSEWAGVITIACWTVIAFAFARITRRCTSFLALIGLSTVTIVSIYFLLRAALPLFKWRLLLQLP
jgi:hypothetical protein